MKEVYFFICIFLFLLMITSCGSNKVKTRSFTNSYCMSRESYHNSNFVFMMDTLEYKNILKSDLSKNEILMCKVLSVSKEVDRILFLSEDSSSASRMEQLELRQLISQKISLAKTKLDAIISELDCEGERSDLAGAYLDEMNDSRNTTLTVSSVIVGALTTVLAVMVSDDAEKVIGVTGGLLSAGLGAITIKPKGKRIDFFHKKNLLTPVWKNSNLNHEYPNIVWNIFQIDEFNSEEEGNLLESTRKRWKDFVLGGEITKEDEKLIFGEGGIYTADKLHMRSEMIDQVKSSVRYINQLLAIFESDIIERTNKNIYK